MKIQLNGYDIEILTNEADISIKVMDATGKELSNNTYTQAAQTETEVKPVEMKTADQVAEETTVEGGDENAAGATEEVTGEKPAGEAEVTGESKFYSFEEFKKLMKEGKLK